MYLLYFLCSPEKDRTPPMNSLEKMDRMFLSMFSLPVLV